MTFLYVVGGMGGVLALVGVLLVTAARSWVLVPTETGVSSRPSTHGRRRPVMDFRVMRNAETLRGGFLRSPVNLEHERPDKDVQLDDMADAIRVAERITSALGEYRNSGPGTKSRPQPWR